MNSDGPLGFRAYVSTRSIQGNRIPHRVQGLVIRDYAERMGLTSPRLPAVEYAMPGCYMVLESVLEDLDSAEGVIFYSLFQLPERPRRRRAIYRRIMEAGGSVHGALENIGIWDQNDVRRVEDIFRISELARTEPGKLLAPLLGS